MRWQNTSEDLTGTENDLNDILSDFVELDHGIENLCGSRYIVLSDIKSSHQSEGKEFTVFTVSIQNINAKFYSLFLI